MVAGIVAVIGSVVGYFLSENDRRTLGRTPWGLPSLLWALFWLLSLLLGLVLFLIAHSSEVRRAERGSRARYPASGAGLAGGAGAMSVAERFPAYPQPANVRPERPEENSPAPPYPEAAEPAAQSGATPSPGPAPVRISPPAWHPDPSGRFHYRWWDGSQWTSQVSTDGHYLIDTNPDQRIGPYH